LAGFKQWLVQTDILLLNEVESRALSGLDDLHAVAARLRAMMPEHATLVIKRGPEGAEAWQDGDAAHVPTPPVTVADSIGAGDIFNAGFLSARLAGRDLRSCVRAGVHLASAVIATRPRSFRVDLGDVLRTEPRI
jgi:sugar/nucleoside kinase (ribokinase family)